MLSGSGCSRHSTFALRRLTALHRTVSPEQHAHGRQPIFSKNQTGNTGASTTLRTSEPSARMT